MDEALRTLQQRWRASQSSEDEEAYVHELLRSGAVTPARVAMAAALGHHVAARVIATRPSSVDGDYHEQLTPALQLVPHEAASRFAVLCAERALSVWHDLRPTDKVVRAALEVVKGPHPTGKMLRQHSTRLSRARSEVQAGQGDPAHIERAAMVVSALEHAFMSLSPDELAERGVERDFAVASTAACAADLASQASLNTSAERKWQLDVLCRMLLALE